MQEKNMRHIYPIGRSGDGTGFTFDNFACRLQELCA